MELISRLICAAVSMRLGSYAVAVAGDAAAWLLTGLFSFGLYLAIRSKWPERLG